MPGHGAEKRTGVGPLRRAEERRDRAASRRRGRARMTTTRSAISATTPMSCVIRRRLVPASRASARIRSRICAWTVTSRAVVGSSAMRRRGSSAMAAAIMTRWRMPPENSCGYCARRAPAPRCRRGRALRSPGSAAAAPVEARGATPAPRSSAADRQHRVQRGHRLLEDHADAVAAQVPPRLARRA